MIENRSPYFYTYGSIITTSFATFPNQTFEFLRHFTLQLLRRIPPSQSFFTCQFLLIHTEILQPYCVILITICKIKHFK